MRERDLFWTVVGFFAGLALGAILLFCPTKAAAQGYRIDAQRSYYGYVWNIRPYRYDNGARTVDEALEPNACDRQGIRGFEPLSGADAGSCHASIVGIR